MNNEMFSFLALGAFVLTYLPLFINFSIPLMMGTLGEVLNEKSGNLNLGVEGMMSIGAVFGYSMLFTTGSALLGLVWALIGGMLFSMIHAFATITLRANQTVSGLALTMLGVGLSTLLGHPFVGKQTPSLESLHQGNLGLQAFIQWSNQFVNTWSYLALTVILAIALWFFFRHTLFGIRLRSVGENPKAAMAQGVSVSFYRYLAVGLGGAMSGLAGAYITLVYNTTWREAPIQGRGWIVVALTILARWNPLGALVSGLVFGTIYTLQFHIQPFFPSTLLEGIPYLTTLLVLLFTALMERQKKTGRSIAKISGSPSSLGSIFDPEGR